MLEEIQPALGPPLARLEMKIKPACNACEGRKRGSNRLEAQAARSKQPGNIRVLLARADQVFPLTITVSRA